MSGPLFFGHLFGGEPEPDRGSVPVSTQGDVEGTVYPLPRRRQRSKPRRPSLSWPAAARRHHGQGAGPLAQWEPGEHDS
jgi:hypothetical protein